MNFVISKFVTSVKDLVLISAPYALLPSTFYLVVQKKKKARERKDTCTESLA